MATNRTVIDASAEQVFEVLLDASAYPRWVAGTKALASIDPGWPARGSAFWVAFAGGTRTDRTEMIELDPPERLVLQAHVRPFAVTRVVAKVEPRGGRALLTLTETLWPPPRWRLLRWVGDALLFLRNLEGLRRFRRLAEGRS